MRSSCALACVLAWSLLLAMPAHATPGVQRCRLVRRDGQVVSLTIAQGAGRLARHCASFAPFIEQSPEEIERSIRMLDLVRDVHCDAKSESEVRCALIPHLLVRSYHLHGSWSWNLFGDDIRRRVALRAGTRVDDLPEALREQKERLQSFLAQEGFFDAAVSADAKQAPSDGMEQAIDINIAVQAKHALRVRHVRVEGDVVLPTEMLAAPFLHRNIFHYQSRYRPAALHDDQIKVEERLADAGYIGSHVDVEADLHPEALAVDLTMRIRAGRRIRLDVPTGGPLSAWTLRRLAPFARAKSVDGQTAEAYREAIRRAYQEKGFIHAQVDVTLVPDGPNGVVVRVNTAPGNKSSVYAVSYRHMPTPVLQQALRSLSPHQKRDTKHRHRRWVDADVSHDTEALQARLWDLGYAEASVSASRLEHGQQQALVYDVDLGVREVVEELLWRRMPPSFDGDALLIQLESKPGAPFSKEAIERDRQTLLVELLRQGYAEGDVIADAEPLADSPEPYSVETMTHLPTRKIRVAFTLKPRKRSRYAGMFTQGNFRTRTSTLRHEIPLTLAAPLDVTGIGTARRQLRGLHLFHDVQLTPHRPIRGDARSWLVLRTQERDVRTLDGLIGFSSDFLFSVGADWRDANWLGRAIVFNAQARLSDASDLIPRLRIGNQDLLQVDVRAPHPFGLPVSVDAQAQYRLQDVRDFRERRIGGTAGVTRSLLKRKNCRFCFDVSGRLAYELVEAYRIDKVGLGADNVAQDYTIGRIVPSIDADRRDSSIDPRRGLHISLRLEGAHPNLAPSTYLHRRATRFWRVLVAAQGFIPLGTPPKIPLGAKRSVGGPWVLALSVNYGVAQPYGKKGDPQSAVPPSETFGYGGDLSVRGLYARASTAQLPNPLFLTVLSAELRAYLLEDFGIGSIQLAGFVDVGTVAMAKDELFAATTLSAGPALRYVTPIGPLSLAYGRALLVPDALRQNGSAAPKHGRVHFTFGYTF